MVIPKKQESATEHVWFFKLKNYFIVFKCCKTENNIKPQKQLLWDIINEIFPTYNAQFNGFLKNVLHIIKDLEIIYIYIYLYLYLYIPNAFIRIIDKTEYWEVLNLLKYHKKAFGGNCPNKIKQIFTIVWYDHEVPQLLS